MNTATRTAEAKTPKKAVSIETPEMIHETIFIE